MLVIKNRVVFVMSANSYLRIKTKVSYLISIQGLQIELRVYKSTHLDQRRLLDLSLVYFHNSEYWKDFFPIQSYDVFIKYPLRGLLRSSGQFQSILLVTTRTDSIRPYKPEPSAVPRINRLVLTNSNFPSAISSSSLSLYPYSSPSTYSIPRIAVTK